MTRVIPDFPHTIVQGVTYELIVKLRNEVGDKILLDGYSTVYGIKETSGAPFFSNTPAINLVNNTLTILVAKEVTKDWPPNLYAHELRVRDPSGSEEVLFQGEFRVKAATVSFA